MQTEMQVLMLVPSWGRVTNTSQGLFIPFTDTISDTRVFSFSPETNTLQVNYLKMVKKANAIF